MAEFPRAELDLIWIKSFQMTLNSVQFDEDPTKRLLVTDLVE